ncbi:class I SAM-dependent methyltransferase [Candidatus Bathyarchaeota archaeon]|nr:class I SAM-dependent methyltransferase [Candidatus Bathyarchaeota archaeon]
MYGKAAVYYDAVYSWKDYEKETKKLHKFIQLHKISHGNTLLDVACGPGNHLVFLKKLYAVEGLDLNPIQLAQARKKLPHVRFYKRDMRISTLARRTMS